MGHTKKRSFTVKPPQANSEINITPLVDVVLVLLIIFMVLTPLLEKDIAVQIPETEQDNTPDDSPPDQLIVSLQKDGKILINGNEVNPNDYIDQLRKRVDIRSDKLVFITAEDAAPYPGLVLVLDGARRAGAKHLAMAATVD